VKKEIEEDEIEKTLFDFDEEIDYLEEIVD
jgi:hypothetical protein